MNKTQGCLGIWVVDTLRHCFFLLWIVALVCSLHDLHELSALCELHWGYCSKIVTRHSAEVLANGYIKVSRSETDEVCRAVLTVLRCKTFYRRTLTFFPSFPLAGSLPSPHFNSHSIFTRSDNTLSHAVKSRKSISLSRPVKTNSFKNHLERPDMK